jgi:hypothetical protein
MAGFFLFENFINLLCALHLAYNHQKKEQQAHGCKPDGESCDYRFDHEISPLMSHLLNSSLWVENRYISPLWWISETAD